MSRLSDEPDGKDELATAIQAVAAGFDDGGPEHAVLLGYVLVAEWAANDGNRWLTRKTGDAFGHTLPVWTTKGYLIDSLDDLAASCEGDGDDDPEG